MCCQQNKTKPNQTKDQLCDMKTKLGESRPKRPRIRRHGIRRNCRLRAKNPDQATNHNYHLPLEIVEDILHALPVKSLNRFRCVSTSWQSLISENQFAKKHLARTSQSRAVTNKSLIFNISNAKVGINNNNNNPSDKLRLHPLYSIKSDDASSYLISSSSSPFDTKKDDIELLASCDELLCVRVIKTSSVYVWNPNCVKTCYEIPSPPITAQGPSVYNDTTISIGFSYDSIRDDYKVFRLSRIGPLGRHSRVETDMYSFRTNSWIKLQDFPRPFHPFCKSEALNGSIYWLARWRNNTFGIFSYNLSEDEYIQVPLPDLKPMPSFEDVDMCCLHGMICLSIIGNTSLDIWATDEDYYYCASWTKILSIQVEPFHFVAYEVSGDVACEISGEFKPLYMYENGEILVLVIRFDNYGQITELLICKDNEIVSRETIFYVSSIWDAFIHVGSLVSPRIDVTDDGSLISL